MTEQQSIIQQTFDSVADGYDSPALRFFPASARELVTSLDLRGDEQVLDVATGTGHAAMALAAYLPRGRVTGVDFSAAMLEQARRKAKALDMRNVEFLERDMRELGFAAAPFDAAVCAFGIFFVEDMEAQLTHIAATVKPGGRVAICNFHEAYFGPLKELFVKRLDAYGVQLPPQHWKRIAHESGCRELFARAGLRDVRVELKNVGYFLTDEYQWWDIIWNAGYRRLVSRLAPAELARFQQEHLAEVAALATGDGIWLDVGVLFTVGSRL
ncbi:MAG: methyltransferase type 11 [Desulfobulbaceae bacterium A2]|nr:MAG: methyltransferase type 11 [Desulfobulbaceae bacterium A2]